MSRMQAKITQQQTPTYAGIDVGMLAMESAGSVDFIGVRIKAELIRLM